MGINIGNKELKEAFLGSKTISEIYLGATKIWPVSSQPAFDIGREDVLYLRVNVKDPNEKFIIPCYQGNALEFDWNIQIDDGPVVNYKGPRWYVITLSIPVGEHLVTITPKNGFKVGWAGNFGAGVNYPKWNNDRSKLEFWMENFPVRAFAISDDNFGPVGHGMFYMAGSLIKTPNNIIFPSDKYGLPNNFMHSAFMKTGISKVEDGFIIPKHIKTTNGKAYHSAFRGCPELESIGKDFEIPENLTHIPYGNGENYEFSWMFADCPKLGPGDPSLPFKIPAKPSTKKWTYFYVYVFENTQLPAKWNAFGESFNVKRNSV